MAPVTPRPAPTCEQKALELLARRAHFRSELGRKLSARGYEAEEIAATLDRLTERGYLNEAELAEHEAARLSERKGLARAGVAASLARRGVSRPALDAALGDDDRARELGRARQAAEKWLRAGRSDAAALARHLDRKGYTGHAIFRVLNELGLREGARGGAREGAREGSDIEPDAPPPDPSESREPSEP